MSVTRQINSLSKLYTYYEEVLESFLDETDVDSYFYQNISDIALIDNRIVRVSKGSNIKVFAFKLFQFCNLKNQQIFILGEEVSVSVKELAAILNTPSQFLKQYDKTVKFPALYPSLKPKQEIGLTLIKDELFAHYFQNIKKHCNRPIRLSFRFERNNGCCFSIKKFQIYGEQNVLKEIIYLRHCEVHNFYQNCYYCASNCWNFDSNCDSNILAQVLYQGQCIVQLIGYVICPKKNEEAKSAYT